MTMMMMVMMIGVIVILMKPVRSRSGRPPFFFKQRLHSLASLGIVNKVCPEIIFLIITKTTMTMTTTTIITNIIPHLGIFPSVLARSSRRASLSSRAMLWLFNASINCATWLKSYISNNNNNNSNNIIIINNNNNNKLTLTPSPCAVDPQRTARSSIPGINSNHLYIDQHLALSNILNISGILILILILIII